SVPAWDEAPLRIPEAPNLIVKRMILMLILVAAVLGVVGFVKLKQIQAGAAQAAMFKPPPEAVTTVVARQEPWPSGRRLFGYGEPVQGFTRSAAVPGIGQSTVFESGAAVKARDVLVRLAARQEQAQLTAAEARHELDRQNLDRARGLLKE